MGVIVLFVLIAGRPSESPPVGPEDAVAAVAAGVDASGAVVLSTGQKVQLLGLQLPTGEDPPLVRVAASEMLDRLVRGRSVLVEYDPVLPGAVQAGRAQTVGYLWVLDGDGRRRVFVNLALVARGLARPVAGMSYDHQADFIEAAALARDRGAGVWRPDPSAVGPAVPLAGAPPF